MCSMYEQSQATWGYGANFISKSTKCVSPTATTFVTLVETWKKNRPHKISTANRKYSQSHRETYRPQINIGSRNLALAFLTIPERCAMPAPPSSAPRWPPPRGTRRGRRTPWRSSAGPSRSGRAAQRSAGGRCQPT